MFRSIRSAMAGALCESARSNLVSSPSEITLSLSSASIQFVDADLCTPKSCSLDGIGGGVPGFFICFGPWC